jgi:crotonobetainyl-CoA:carnitine CoA-transferase CaiB-like acyl-CoA transferase
MDRPDSDSSLAASYAARLLDSLGLKTSGLYAPARHPAIGWAASGLMELTGLADAAPQMCPLPVAACADGALAALTSLTTDDRREALQSMDGAVLLAERAALMGLGRAGPVSPGGACRLYQVADGWIALNLARAADCDLLPALLELEQAPSMEALPDLLARHPVQQLVERGRLLGLALAADQPPAASVPPWFTVHARGPVHVPAHGQAPRVIDLSSLWAGPLCSRLLKQLGAEVIKVESPDRPDGARLGHTSFFDRLNAGKSCIALDLRSAEGQEQLRALIRSADIVIEGSRPRGMRQLGIIAEDFLRETPGLSWIAISGHGRGEPQENWVGYGDDTAVAAGLSHVLHQATGLRLIGGDAIADPLTGLHAALAAWASYRRGGGLLLSLALSQVTAHAIAFDLPTSTVALRQRYAQWTALAQGSVLQPQVQPSEARASALGADTTAVLARLPRPC